MSRSVWAFVAIRYEARAKGANSILPKYDSCRIDFHGSECDHRKKKESSRSVAGFGMGANRCTYGNPETLVAWATGGFDRAASPLIHASVRRLDTQGNNLWLFGGEQAPLKKAVKAITERHNDKGPGSQFKTSLGDRDLFASRYKIERPIIASDVLKYVDESMVGFGIAPSIRSVDWNGQFQITAPAGRSAPSHDPIGVRNSAAYNDEVVLNLFKK